MKKNNKVRISVSLSEVESKRIRKKARRLGYKSVSAYVRHWCAD